MTDRPKLVIFDCDGVIVDSEPLLLELLQSEFSDHGLDISIEELENKYLGSFMSKVAERARADGAHLPENWETDIYSRIYAKLSLGTPLVPGIQTVFERLETAGLPFCVGSNGPEEKMEITLGQHPDIYAKLKGKIFSAHTYKTAKPDPDLYLIAARTMGVAPQDCVVVDDSPSGCQAGISAGMRVLGFDRHGDGARLVDLGAEHLADMKDLPARIGL